MYTVLVHFQHLWTHIARHLRAKWHQLAGEAREVCALPHLDSTGSEAQGFHSNAIFCRDFCLILQKCTNIMPARKKDSSNQCMDIETYTHRRLAVDTYGCGEDKPRVISCAKLEATFVTAEAHGMLSSTSRRTLELRSGICDVPSSRARRKTSESERGRGSERESPCGAPGDAVIRAEVSSCLQEPRCCQILCFRL